MDAADLGRLLAALERRFAVRLTARERDALPLYLEVLQKWNRRINLTGDDSAEAVLSDHIFEALWAGRHFIGPQRHLADIGSGAGFPGLFLALADPELRTTLIERQGKRAAFLKEAARRLHLSVQVWEGRAESYGGWADVGITSLRAVRMSPGLLEPLAVHGVKLLWFHTDASEMPGPPWTTEIARRVPGSEHRRVTLLQPS